MSSPHTPLAGLHPIITWLLDESRPLNLDALVVGLCERLLEAGVPLRRAFIPNFTAHPEVFGRASIWQRGEPLAIEVVSHTEIAGMPVGPASSDPVGLIRGGGVDEVRQRLTVPDEQLTMDLFRKLKAQGLTDYLALVLELSDRRSALSWSSDHPDGFSGEHVALLRSLMPFLTLRLELESTRHSLASLMEVYLGGNAARRVLGGSFKRGSGERIQAAVWLCDLRGFTRLADQVPAEEVVSTLDSYFDRVVGAVHDQGGEVLKFIGDAILAIFRVQGGDEQQACQAALAAGTDALARLGALNEERSPQGLPSLAMGVALHLGQVMYGNIGSRERLDFTVIGASVNEASRLESLCKQLGTPLVMSGHFARAARREDIVPLGRHTLRGVREEREVFGLRSLLPPVSPRGQ